MKERLVEFLEETGMVEGRNRCKIIAEELIANGVTIKKEKQPTDLAGKCGSCAYAKAECPEIYVRCTNPEHIAKYFRSRDKSLRQRTNPACKQYKPKK